MIGHTMKNATLRVRDGGLRGVRAMSASHELLALSGVDGRYASKVDELRPYFSEYGLIRHRVAVELKWLQALSEDEMFPYVSSISDDATQILVQIGSNFSEEHAEEVKEIESVTNHDVKAVEYWLKRQFESHPELSKISEFLHWACTSEDINNLAYATMLHNARNEVLVPSMSNLVSTLRLMAHEFADVPMMCRTHGQPATPSTMGKELGNFAFRMDRQLGLFKDVPMFAKINGAVGNFNAHAAAVPEINWTDFAQKFISGLGVTYNPYTTQIEPHDTIAELFDAAARYNTVLLDMNRDMWSYTSLGYFKLRTVASEVGSSTMPHKVNPIDFENSEGNIGIANAIFGHLATKLPVSRFQRDLSDSTVLRNVGVGFANSLIAYKAASRGLGKVECNPELMAAELGTHWELLAEPVQTVMRLHGVEEPYEKLKAFTRGKQIDAETMHAFIQDLDIPDKVKTELLEMTPLSYLGYASRLAREV